MLGFELIGRVAAEVRRDIGAARSRDPAARGVGWFEILLAWPGVHALLAHRVAHALHEAGVPLLPRMIAALSRAITGIEIHPAAQIGRGFFIDHGMGVVIGETAELGDDVTLYQGVTLGGTGFATGKRHPTVQDNVTIGSGAKLLGPITVGHGSKVGANSVVIHDVPANSTVVGNPGHPVRVEGRRPEGPDADWVHLPGPDRGRDQEPREPDLRPRAGRRRRRGGQCPAAAAGQRPRRRQRERTRYCASGQPLGRSESGRRLGPHSRAVTASGPARCGRVGSRRPAAPAVLRGRRCSRASSPGRAAGP